MPKPCLPPLSPRRAARGLIAPAMVAAAIGIPVAARHAPGDEPPAAAIAEGQDDLDAAVDAKLGADSMDDFDKVLDLVRTALREGLDEPSRKFANDLYTGTLVDRATMITETLFAEGAEVERQWEQLRAFALRDLREVVERDDTLSAAHSMIARLEALPGGDRQRAAAAARRAIELGGDDPLQTAQAHLVLGNLADGDPAERRAQYDKAVELAPGSADVRRTRGLFLMTEGDTDAALVDIDAAIAEDPDDLRLRELRGLALLMGQRVDEARQTFDEALERAPDSADLLFQRGRLFASLGDDERALADIDKAIGLAPQAAEPLVLRARLRQKAGDSDAARADLERVLGQQPEHQAALEMRGLLAADRGDYGAAIGDFRRLVRQHPDDALLVGQLGLLYLADKQPREAIRRFNRALEIDPEQFLARRGRSDAEISVGDHAAAIADLEKAMELEPDNEGVLNNLAWVLATSPEDVLRDGKRAVEIATKACELSEWRQPHIISTLAAAHAETGDFEQAKTYSRRAVEGSEEAPDIRTQLESELASYEAGKPWRERQTLEDDGAAAAAPPAAPRAPAARPRAQGRRPFDD